MTMNSESPSHKPAPGGSQRRVRITYDVLIGDQLKKIELPFVVGVLADLSGQPMQPLRPFKERKAVLVDRGNFNEVLSQAGARLVLRVPNRLTDPGTSLMVELNFRNMDDFKPARVAEQIAPLRELLAKRRELCEVLSRMEVNPVSGSLLAEILANTECAMGPALDASSVPEPLPSEVAITSPEQAQIGNIDRAISAQLNEVMHHADFQQLEGTWRGLNYLVSQTETGENLKIRVLNITKRELSIDQEKAVKFDESILFKKIHDETYGWLGGEPYGLLVGDYEFSHAPEDVNLLKMISHVAAAAHAPFVAAASARIFGISQFGELPKPRELAKVFERVEYSAWRSFRESEDSRFTALTLPRVLSRLPYGANFTRVEEFNFEETADKEQFAWMSSAWPYAVRVTDAFAKWGWMARTRGVEGGGKVEGLPVHNFPTTDGGIALRCSTEIAISERHEFELSKLGFLQPLHNKDTGSAVYMGAESCHKPQKYHDPAATSAAELSSKVNLLLCASRFVHYLKIMARDKIGTIMNAAECQRWLNDWILQYCEQGDEISDTGSAERPLSDARVEIQPVAGKPGWHKLVVDLVPYFQVENLTAALRLVAEIPRLG